MSRDLKILYVSSEDVSRGDGPGVNEREFIRALHKRVGDNAHFVIPDPAEVVSDIPRSACTFYKSHHRHHPLHFLGHLLSQARTVARELSSRDYDLVVYRLDLLPLAMRYLAGRFTTPYAIKTLSQGTVIVLEARSLVHKILFSGLNVALTRKLVVGAVATDVCSEPMIDYFADKLRVEAERFTWIDNAVDTSRFVPASAVDVRKQVNLSAFDPVVGYIGSQPSQRGGRHLIELAPQLLKKYPGLGVLIVGAGPGLAELKDRADELGVSDKCVFTGYIPFDDVPLYANALDVGVSISHRADRFAAAELKVRQYLACGKPVVASAGSNDFLEEHDLGSVVDAEDAAAIERELDRWLSMSQTENDAVSARARKYVCEHLSFEAAVERRLELWAQGVWGNGQSS